jgi:signal transduction histidine kinase
VDRARARLLSSMILCVLFMAVAIALVLLARPQVIAENWFMLLSGVSVLYGLYRLSRTHRYQVTAYLTVGWLVFGISYGALTAGSRIAATTGLLLVLPIVLSAIILHARATVIIMGIGIVLGVLLLFINRETWVLDVILIICGYTLTTLMIVIFDRYRHFVDSQHSNEIIAMNNSLVAVNRELRQAKEAAEETTRMKTQFLANMSHELRTPLTAIIGYADLQLMGITGEISQQQREYLDRIQVNGRHLISMINEVLDISRVDAGRLQLEEQAVELAALAEQWRSQTEVLARGKGLAFSVELDPALPAIIVVDPNRLTQIALNLLSNAIKFTSQGRVELTLRRAGEQWMLRVSDTGPGIPAEAQQYIFDEFRQVDSSTTRQHDGTGLGLAIVHRLSGLMGGTVALESEVGRGSTFTVTLPLGVANSMQAEPVLTSGSSALARVLTRPGVPRSG